MNNSSEEKKTNPLPVGLKLKTPQEEVAVPECDCQKGP